MQPEDNLPSLEEIVQKREEIANSLSDITIHRTVIKSILTLEIDDEQKIDLMLQAVPDTGIIFSQLLLMEKNHLLSTERYNGLSQLCLDKINERKAFTPFNPLFLNIEEDERHTR